MRSRHAMGVLLELRLIPVVQWSFTGVVLGSALAARNGSMNWAILSASAVVAMLIHGVIAHTANDIVDWESGTDTHPSPRVLSGGSKVIGRGLLTPAQLRVMGFAGATLATAIGVVLASQRGWWLLIPGLAGMVGAAVYSLPPLRGAYRPVTGEGIAVMCGWICLFGADAVQRGDASPLAALVALHWVLACMTMLMLHHIPDREADLAASPPKRTTVARFATHPHWYAAAWPIAGAIVGAGIAATTLPELWPSVIGALLAAASALVARPDDLASVTRSEILSVLVVMVGGLVSAALMYPPVAWMAVVPALLLPLDAAVGRRALAIPATGFAEPRSDTTP